MREAELRASAAPTYVAAYVALLALSCATLGLSFFSLGILETVLALAIAALKGVVIAVFFMHLGEQRPVNALFLMVALLLVVFFVTLSAADVGTRADRPSQSQPRPAAQNAPASDPASLLTAQRNPTAALAELGVAAEKSTRRGPSRRP